MNQKTWSPSNARRKVTLRRVALKEEQTKREKRWCYGYIRMPKDDDFDSAGVLIASGDKIEGK